MKTAIIGAGVAGLAAARQCKAAGHEVRLFDKGRGPGGRLSTRRAETALGDVRWDHGAQYFTARSEAFRKEIAGLRQEGAVDIWAPRMADIRKSPAGWTVGLRPTDPQAEPLYVGRPGMNGLVKGLARDLDVAWGRRVSALRLEQAGKYLSFEDGGAEGPFDYVISAVPAEQAVELLSPVSSKLAEAARGVKSAPCWAVMLAFDAPVPVAWEAASLNQASIAWAARNGSKPGRAPGESWVLHAGVDWSRAHVESSAESVIAELIEEFRALTVAPQPAHASAHRWLYARVEKGAGDKFGWDEAAGIGSAGDWHIAPRIEAAWQSGHELGQWLCLSTLTS